MVTGFFKIRVVLSCTCFCRHDDEGNNDKQGHAPDAPAARHTLLLALSSGIARIDNPARIAHHQVLMGDKDLSGASVVIGTDDAGSLELADEFGSPVVGEVEAVAQHHGRDGWTALQVFHHLVEERVGAGWGWGSRGGQSIDNGTASLGWRGRCGSVSTEAAVGAEVGIAAHLTSALGTVDGLRGLHCGIQLKALVGDIGIVAHDLQFRTALGTGDLVLAVDEGLDVEVHLLAAFGTGVVHIEY